MKNEKEIATKKIKCSLRAILRSSIKYNISHAFAPHIEKIIKNITWLLIDKTLQLGIGLLVGAWVARYLGPSDFGEISYILALVGIFQILSQLGINNIAVRELSTHQNSQADIIGTLVRLRVISAILCFGCAIFLFYLMNPGEPSKLLIAAIISGALVLQPSEVIDLWFQSELKSKRTVYAKLTSNIIANTIKVAFILLKMPLIAFAIVFLIESIIFALALHKSYRKYSTFGYGSWNADICRRMAIEGAPFLLSSLLLATYIQLDKVLIAKIGSTTEAGYYAAAITLTSLFNVLPMIICTSLAPLIATIYTKEDRLNFFTKLYSFLFWAAATFSFLLIIFAENIILLLYGSSYYGGILATQILALSIIPVFISVANDYLALNKKTSKATLARTIIGLVANLILSITLIPPYGAVGAATAIAIAHWLSNTVLYWLILRESFSYQIKGLAMPYFLLTNIKLK